MPHAWVVVGDVAEHGHEHEQQREHGQESVVRDQRGELAATVVAVLLDHRDDERDRTMALLPAIHLVEELHEESIPNAGPCYSWWSNARIRSANDGSIAGPVSITMSCSVPVHGNGGS